MSTLADKINRTRGYISHLCNSRRHLSPDDAELIADAFRLQPIDKYRLFRAAAESYVPVEFRPMLFPFCSPHESDHIASGAAEVQP